MENNQDFVIENGVLTEYNGPGGDVVIPESVKKIGGYVFFGCTSLTRVTILAGIAEIDKSVFENCRPVLTAPRIPIAAFAAADKPGACAGFARLYLEQAELDEEIKAGYLKYIKAQKKRLFPIAVRHEDLLQLMFAEKMLVRKDIDLLLEECGKQNNIAAKAAVLDYAGKNLKPVDPMKEMNWEFAAMERAIERSAKNQEEFQATGVMKVGEAKKIFRYKKLEKGGLIITGYKGTDTDIVIPKAIGEDLVKTIRADTFNCCTGLTSVTIPEGVTEIGGDAFKGHTGLTEILVDANNSAYHSEDGMLLSKECLLVCPAGKTGNVTVPEGVTEIGRYAFSGCMGLTSVVIPEGVTKIGNGAFVRCTGLTSVTIPAGVTEIGGDAFSGCTGLTSVTIPAGVTKIGGYAFNGCTGLTIHAPAGSATEQYAKENDIKFEAL